MSLDGGGRTLVWKNSFMDNFPLSDNMRYYSGYYKACTSLVDGGWCNIPDKASFSPTEQMMVAYHNTALVYAYKGIFNHNINYGWSGGIFYWTLRRLWTSVHFTMVFSQLLMFMQFLVLHLTNAHRITTTVTVILCMVH